MASFGLGRMHAPDLRDAKFPLSAVLTKKTFLKSFWVRNFSSKIWETGPVLDQGHYPYCVGYSWEGFLQAVPTQTMNGPTPTDIYNAAQQVDEWPGPPPEYDGTSVRAGAKALQAQGHLTSYHWAGSVDEIKEHVLTRGTVVVGTSWYGDMFFPDRDGYLHPAGDLAGGHAWLIIGYSWMRKAFLMQNSWGTTWGKNGRAWIRKIDLELLLADNGEACVGIE